MQARTSYRSLIAAILLGAGNASPGAEAQSIVDPDLDAPLAATNLVNDALYLEVFVNGLPTGLIAEFRRDPLGRLSSPANELIELGFDVPPGDRIVPLNTITSLDYRYDPLEQTLDIEVASEALTPQALGPSQPEAVEADPSFGLAVNYDASLRTWQDEAGNMQADGLGLVLDAWAFSPWGRAGTTGYAVFPFDRDQEPEWVRYDSVVQHDVVGRALSIRAGDVITSSLSWGRPVRIGGFQFQKDFSLRRDLVTAPMLSYSGSAAVPSTVDVFVDGSRVYSGPTEPGRFRLDNVPVQTGPGTAIVTLRGPDGEASRQELAFFGARDLLGQGVFDYSVEAGQPRLNYGSVTSDYLDETAASATFRFGLTDGLTLSGHAEGMGETYLAGFGADFVLGRHAEMSITAGGSHDSVRTGTFGEVTMSAYPFGWLSLDASAYRSSGEFADLAYAVDRATGVEADASRPPAARDVVTVGFTGKSQTFGLSYIRSDQGGRRNRLASMGYSRGFDRVGGTLSVSGSHDFVRDETRFAVLFSLVRGRRTHQAQLDHDGEASVLTSRALGEQPGSMGYAVQAMAGAKPTRIAARVERQTRFGRATGQIDTISGRTSAEIRFQGAVAVMDRRMAAGRRIHDSFAMVDAGRAGVPVRLENREVARTGPGGHALVSGLTSYHSNRLSVNVDDLPGNAVWATSATDVVPARRSGVAVDFGISDVSTSRLVALIDGAGHPLSLGTPVTINGRKNEFEVGYDGLVLLQEAAPGLTVEAGTGATVCRAVLPPITETASGPLPCL